MLGKRKVEEVSFADFVVQNKSDKWEKHWLKKADDLIDWRPFEKRLNKLYPSNEGRPSWEPLLLFKALLLSKWYNLSDRQLEEALEFRIDFCRFTGLTLDRSAPDYTTFSVFRKRIQPIWDKLLSIITRQLEKYGYAVQDCISVDASLIEAHQKPKKRDDKDQDGDSDASWRGFPKKELRTKDGGKEIARRPALFGYKLNMACTFDNQFISGFSLCKASEHETHHLMEFVNKDTKAVYADKGYSGKEEEIVSSGVRSFIQRKATRGNALTRKEINRNIRIGKKRKLIEAIFGTLKHHHHWRKTKYIGLERNSLAMAIQAISWNIKKLIGFEYQVVWN